LKTILEILTEIRPEFDFTGSRNFIEEGLLDSLDVVTLVSDIEKNYGISIEGVDILPENFRNAAAIKTLLQRYGVQQ
jgi:acyl carrier protein